MYFFLALTFSILIGLTSAAQMMCSAGSNSNHVCTLFLHELHVLACCVV